MKSTSSPKNGFSADEDGIFNADFRGIFSGIFLSDDDEKKRCKLAKRILKTLTAPGFQAPDEMYGEAEDASRRLLELVTGSSTAEHERTNVDPVTRKEVRLFLNEWDNYQRSSHTKDFGINNREYDPWVRLASFLTPLVFGSVGVRHLLRGDAYLPQFPPGGLRIGRAHV